MNETCRVVQTRAGTPAILDLTTGEVMHPVGAPGEESRDVYVAGSNLAARLSAGGDEPLVVLDVGLGAASNAIAAWNVSEGLGSTARPLWIVSFDNSLDPLRVALASDQAASFGLDGDAGLAARSLLETCQAVGSNTRWRFVQGDLPETLAAEPSGSADVVYWDMFSPKSDPRLWSVAMFRTLRRVCREGATVHTYAASTASRSALLLGGFAVGRGRNTGDRETTIAATSVEHLQEPLGERWLSRLSRSSAPFPVDAPSNAKDSLLAAPQFRGVLLL